MTKSARAGGWPWAGSEHGPLSALLVTLTVVTGLVDAVSYLALGHVFVANMTGNVVFLGFALAGAPACLRRPRWPRWARFLSAPSPAVVSRSGPARTEGASCGRR